jgi:hypothetical protein
MNKLNIANLLFFILVVATSVKSSTPINDNFSNAIFIYGSEGSITGSYIGATLETDEPQLGSVETVWYSWSASDSATYKFNIYGNHFFPIGIFTGNSVNSLSRVVSGIDNVCFDASAGCNYQIQVSGYIALTGMPYQIQVSEYQKVDEGEFVLNWQPSETYSDWILSYSDTNVYVDVWLASDLSAFSYEYSIINNDYHQTNNLGCIKRKYEELTDYSNGFSIEDKKNYKKVEKKPLGKVGENISIEDYNGKQILVYEAETKKLIVFIIKKDTFIKLGEQEIKDFDFAWFEGTEIYVMICDNTKEGLKVFDKKLKKEKWTELLAEGDLDIINKGLTARKVWKDNNLTITCKKKGKKNVSKHNLTEPFGYNLNYIIDKKGGVLYWLTETATMKTNSPLTYLDRKGKKVVDNLTMTDVGNIWTYENFDGKTLFIRKKDSNTIYTFYVYKLKGLEKLGQQVITIPQSGGISYTSFGKKVYIIPTYYKWDSGNNYAAYVFDKKLKKQQWEEDYANGNLSKIGKDTLQRCTTSTSGNTTTKSYKLFNKKGEIVTYIFTYIN